MTAVSSYCYLIKYQAKRKHLLSLKEPIYRKYEIKMSNKIKDMNIKNDIYYFFDYIINIKSFDPNNTKLDEKLYKNILIN